MAKNYLGIDLGTTETTVAVIAIEGVTDEPIDKLRTLNVYQYNTQHEFDKDNQGLASSIYIDRDNKKIYTGEYANALYANGNKPLNTIRSVKTRIGGESMIQVPLDSDKSNLANYGMTELSALLLKTVKKAVASQITGNLDGVTITIPAGFNSDERTATIEAADIAGFKQINLLDEPTAVLLNYLNQEDSLDGINDDFFYSKKNVLVYDIGGGTLDISIAEVEDEEGDFRVDILGRSKRMDFGGDDIDKYIAAYFLSEFEKINESIENRTAEDQAIIVSRIVSNAQRSKVSFNTKLTKVIDNKRRRSRVRETVNFEIIDNLKITDLSLTDEILKQVLAPVLQQNGLLIKPIKQSLRESKLEADDIDLVILTGGSGKFYLVEETLRRFFAKGVEIIEFTERNAVSKGAAIHSYNQIEGDDGELKQIDISDLMSDSVFIKSPSGFDPLVPHDQPLDSRGHYNFKFEQPSNRLEAFLYYGSGNEELHKYTEITGVFKKLNRFYEKGESLRLDWTFDSNKIVKLFFEGEELLSTQSDCSQNYELLTDFHLN